MQMVLIAFFYAYSHNNITAFALLIQTMFYVHIQIVISTIYKTREVLQNWVWLQIVSFFLVYLFLGFGTMGYIWWDDELCFILPAVFIVIWMITYFISMFKYGSKYVPFYAILTFFNFITVFWYFGGGTDFYYFLTLFGFFVFCILDKRCDAGDTAD